MLPRADGPDSRSLGVVVIWSGSWAAALERAEDGRVAGAWSLLMVVELCENSPPKSASFGSGSVCEPLSEDLPQAFLGFPLDGDRYMEENLRSKVQRPANFFF